MRTLITLAFALSSCLSLSGQTLKCRYLHEYSREENRKCFLKDYALCVETDGLEFICYSENEFLWDSVITAMFASGETYYETKDEKNEYPYGVDWFIVGDLRNGTYTEYNSHFALYFKGSGTYVQPNWTLSTETAEFCGYHCIKASTEYLGRTWTIWFTEEIPTSSGPWLLWGAPGLILMAEDEDGLFRFTCEEITQTNSSRREKLLERFEETSTKPGSHCYSSDIATIEGLYTKVKRYPSYNDELTGSITTVYGADGKKKEITILPYIPFIPDEYWKHHNSL